MQTFSRMIECLHIERGNISTSSNLGIKNTMPRKIVCIYCGKIHEKKYDCGKRPQYKKDKDNRINKFHWSREWKRKSSEIRGRDIVCKYCLAVDKVIQTTSLSVHHIIPLQEKEGWDARLEDWNLITLCNMCHERAENGRIERKILLNLVPAPGKPQKK